MPKIISIIFSTWLLILSLLLMSGCRSDATIDSSYLDSLLVAMKDGDLIFRRGTGFVGHVVTKADKEGLYSHVGIVVSKDSIRYVVHAVPHEPDFEGDIDRVKCESIHNFVARYPNANIGLYRLTISDSLITIAVSHALRLSKMSIPFDHTYNLEDSTALYCTELVEYVYGQVGVSLSEGRRTDVYLPGMTGKYIMPSDITQCSKLSLVAYK